MAELTPAQRRALEPLRDGPMRASAYLDEIEPDDLASLPHQAGDDRWLLLTSNVPRLVVLTLAGRAALEREEKR